MSSREEFESWCVALWGGHHLGVTLDPDSGEYILSHVQFAWSAWSARDARIAELEQKREGLRLAVAELIGTDSSSWPDHGNIELAIAAFIALSLAQAKRDHDRIADLEQALARIVKIPPPVIDGQFALEHYSSEGYPLGVQVIDPMSVVSKMVGVAEWALDEKATKP